MILHHLPRQSCSLYEKQARASSVSQCSHSAHPHTSEPYNTLHKLKLHMHSHTGNTTHTLVCSSHSSHSLLTLVHTRTQTWDVDCVTSCRDRTTNMSLALSGFAECRALPSQADIPPPPCSHTYPLWVLYGPILSFLLLSPRGAMAMFSRLFNDCGWTINILHTSKHSSTPTWCCRLNSENKGKDRFSKMSLKSVLVRVLIDPSYESWAGSRLKSTRYSLLNVP